MASIDAPETTHAAAASSTFPSSLNYVGLVVIGEPFSEDNIERILKELEKGLKNWDIDAEASEYDEVLKAITEVDILEVGLVHRLLSYAGSHLGLVIAINPSLSVVSTELQQLLIHPAPHKHLIYAGHTSEGSGDWLLHDDTLTLADIAEVFADPLVDAAIVKSSEEQKPTLVLSGCHWSTGVVTKQAFSKSLNLTLNPGDIKHDLDSIAPLLDTIKTQIVILTPFELLEPPTMGVGIKCKITKPTVLIFPAAKGDCGFFAVGDFSIFIGGGYCAKSCFWKFAKHLNRVDAILLPHMNPDCLLGVNSFLQRKLSESQLDQPDQDNDSFGDWQTKCNSPELGVVYMNAPPNKKAPTQSLVLKTILLGTQTAKLAKELGCDPIACTAGTGKLLEPVTLFQKVGIGRLDMYILSPTQNSKELKDFFQQWGSGKAFSKAKTGVKVNDKDGELSLVDTVSICALIVWQPWDPEEDIIRVLFPGNAPQNKILEGLDRVKHLDFLKYEDVSRRKLTNGGKSLSKKKPASTRSGKSIPMSNGPVKKTPSPAKVGNTCEDGVHCNTPPPSPTGACSDGVNCNTPPPSEESSRSFVPIGKCDDGIHCNTPPPEEDVFVCSDGKHCNTPPSEVCSDGKHCNTPPPEDVCCDGEHCNTPPPEEVGDHSFIPIEKCDDGIHCNTPPPEDGVCKDGVNCNTPPPEEESNGIGPTDGSADSVEHGGADLEASAGGAGLEQQIFSMKDDVAELPEEKYGDGGFDGGFDGGESSGHGTAVTSPEQSPSEPPANSGLVEDLDSPIDGQPQGLTDANHNLELAIGGLSAEVHDSSGIDTEDSPSPDRQNLWEPQVELSNDINQTLPPNVVFDHEVRDSEPVDAARADVVSQAVYEDVGDEEVRDSESADATRAEIVSQAVDEEPTDAPQAEIVSQAMDMEVGDEEVKDSEPADAAQAEIVSQAVDVEAVEIEEHDDSSEDVSQASEIEVKPSVSSDEALPDVQEIQEPEKAEAEYQEKEEPKEAADEEESTPLPVREEEIAIPDVQVTNAADVQAQADAEFDNCQFREDDQAVLEQLVGEECVPDVQVYPPGSFEDNFEEVAAPDIDTKPAIADEDEGTCVDDVATQDQQRTVEQQIPAVETAESPEIDIGEKTEESQLEENEAKEMEDVRPLEENDFGFEHQPSPEAAFDEEEKGEIEEDSLEAKYETEEDSLEVKVGTADEQSLEEVSEDKDAYQEKETTKLADDISSPDLQSDLQEKILADTPVSDDNILVAMDNSQEVDAKDEEIRPTEAEDVQEEDSLEVSAKEARDQEEVEPSSEEIIQEEMSHEEASREEHSIEEDKSEELKFTEPEENAVQIESKSESLSVSDELEKNDNDVSPAVNMPVFQPLQESSGLREDDNVIGVESAPAAVDVNIYPVEDISPNKEEGEVAPEGPNSEIDRFFAQPEPHRLHDDHPFTESQNTSDGVMEIEDVSAASEEIPGETVTSEEILVEVDTSEESPATPPVVPTVIVPPVIVPPVIVPPVIVPPVIVPPVIVPPVIVPPAVAPAQPEVATKEAAPKREIPKNETPRKATKSAKSEKKVGDIKPKSTRTTKVEKTGRSSLPGRSTAATKRPVAEKKETEGKTSATRKSLEKRPASKISSQPAGRKLESSKVTNATKGKVSTSGERRTLRAPSGSKTTAGRPTDGRPTDGRPTDESRTEVRKSLVTSTRTTTKKTESQRPGQQTKPGGTTRRSVETTKRTTERTTTRVPSGKTDPKRNGAKRPGTATKSSVGTKQQSIPISGPPVYVDLTYVPNHGAAENVNSEFFRRVRAKHYVMSGNDNYKRRPNTNVLEAFLEGKLKWEDENMPTVLIPTHDVMCIREWQLNKQTEIDKAKIEIAVPASRSIVQMKDENFFMYKVEFDQNTSE